VAYFFKWIPLVGIAAVFILSLPWLGVIALMVVAAALAALAAATVYVPYRFGRKIIHNWHAPELGATVAGKRDGVLVHSVFWERDVL
jgi:hypothetical protein